MYFPVGWPRSVNLSLPAECINKNGDINQQRPLSILQLNFDAVKLLLAAIGVGFLGIWYARPLIPIVYHCRTKQSIELYGGNCDIIWKPDSRQLLILTVNGVLLLYHIDCLNGVGANKKQNNGNTNSKSNGENSDNVFIQIDSLDMHLRRDSAELFIKEDIPQLSLNEQNIIKFNSPITTVYCISLTELLMANMECELIRVEWSQLSATSDNLSISKNKANHDKVPQLAKDLINMEVISLRQVLFYVSQHCHMKNVAPIGPTLYVQTLEYSPFIGGYAVIFNDNRAAFLMANNFKFEASNIHGFWIPEVEDATVSCVNHKFRLLAFGRKNSDVSVYGIDDSTGNLEFSHLLTLKSLVMPTILGMVSEMKWSPDGCVIIVAWKNGGFALWSTFGALLMSSHNWEFGVNVDLKTNNPLCVDKMEWSTEGYQLFITCQTKSLYEQTEGEKTDLECCNVMQFNFVKSTLTMNPCMASHPHILLQGKINKIVILFYNNQFFVADDQKLYLNQGNVLENICFGDQFTFPQCSTKKANTHYDCLEIPEKQSVPKLLSSSLSRSSATNLTSSILAENKHWTLLYLPETYLATNWPIRYSSIDSGGLRLAAAGRTGLAHYSLQTKKWKLFGNELQEKDFMVSGGLLWWRDFIIAGCYSLFDFVDEIRCYSSVCRLDNQYSNKISVRAPIIRLNVFRDQLINLTADGTVSIFLIKQTDIYTAKMTCTYQVDLKGICIHPACIVSLTLTNLCNDVVMKNMILSTSSTRKTATTTSIGASSNSSSTNSDTESQTIILNVCGRILMVPKVDNSTTSLNSLMASCLASCVETFWISNTRAEGEMNCFWLFSGIHGMRVWLPILPPVNPELCDTSHLHTFMSKRIMLTFPFKLYPLVILFDNVIALGVENETTLYANESSSHFVLPFSQLERKSLVYLHKILRQLIKRNLGYNAWAIAQSCRGLPYFPHSLELLLHEVLEEEATSKEPIPDALLPRVLDFIREFPIYLQTIVQCARKTEIALWPYLFSIAGEPKDLFQQCLQSENLVTAASYLIILQNLEPTVISKKYAILLLEVSLQHRSWELAKDLIRFLNAIDPAEIDSPRTSMVVSMKIVPQTPNQAQVTQNPDAFNLVLGPTARERSFSTTVLSNVTIKDRKEKSSSFNITNQLDKRVNEYNRISNVGNSNLLSNANIVSIAMGANTVPSTAAVVLRRKSEHNATLSAHSKEKREAFSVEIVLNRIARKLLLDYKILDLGYMSAFLDFHIVGWLSQECQQMTCIQDYVNAITSLHKELKLVSPITMHLTDMSCDSECISLDKCTYTISQSSESGYFSAVNFDAPASNNNISYNNCNELGSKSNYHISDSLNNSCVKKPEESHYSASNSNQKEPPSYLHSNNNVRCSSDLESLSNSLYQHGYQLNEDTHSNNQQETSTVTDVEGEHLGSIVTSSNLYPSRNADRNNIVGSAVTGCNMQSKILPDKFSIKIRYLLQLFIEANCVDFALVLSILLQDAASTGRIINVIIRSKPLNACLHILNNLKRVTQWAFENQCVYRSIMIEIQPHIYHLDHHLQTSSTINIMPGHHLKTMINNNGDLNCIRSINGCPTNDLLSAVNGAPRDNLNIITDKNKDKLHKNINATINRNSSNMCMSVDDWSDYETHHRTHGINNSESKADVHSSYGNIITDEVTRAKSSQSERKILRKESNDRNRSNGCKIM